MSIVRRPSLLIATLVLAVLSIPGLARAAERCLAVAAAPTTPRLLPASERQGALKPHEARLTFIGHSTFLIESGKGVRIATDYNDYIKPPVVPDIVTMNRAHDTHFTNFPEPSIRHVLRGWGKDGQLSASHDIALDDVRVRNVPTNIRGWDGANAPYGNSIFVFEVGEFCIAHLGHLHHTLNPEQLAALGQMDVVLVPVDGSFTMDLDGMIEVLKTINAPLMVPMHYFSRTTLDRFLARVRGTFDVREQDDPSIVLSRRTMPRAPEVLVLPGR
jgi:L-ascorbate metabolism protein UlaG (beta-lactamase superfamily)